MYTNFLNIKEKFRNFGLQKAGIKQVPLSGLTNITHRRKNRSRRYFDTPGFYGKLKYTKDLCYQTILQFSRLV
jgi:hypothetical protein